MNPAAQSKIRFSSLMVLVFRGWPKKYATINSTIYLHATLTCQVYMYQVKYCTYRSEETTCSCVPKRKSGLILMKIYNVVEASISYSSVQGGYPKKLSLVGIHHTSCCWFLPIVLVCCCSVFACSRSSPTLLLFLTHIYSRIFMLHRADCCCTAAAAVAVVGLDIGAMANGAALCCLCFYWVITTWEYSRNITIGLIRTYQVFSSYSFCRGKNNLELMTTKRSMIVRMNRKHNTTAMEGLQQKLRSCLCSFLGSGRPQPTSGRQPHPSNSRVGSYDTKAKAYATGAFPWVTNCEQGQEDHINKPGGGCLKLSVHRLLKMPVLHVLSYVASYSG